MNLSKKSLFFLFVIIHCVSNVCAQNTLSSGWNDELSLEHDGIKRYFRVYVPKGISKKKKAVVLLHPEASGMRTIFKRREKGTRSWKEMADKGKFMLIVPNGMNSMSNIADGDYQFWNDCGDTKKIVYGYSKADDVGFISKVVEYCIKNGDADAKKVYVAGISNGGMMAMRLAIETKLFAAIACFFTNLPEESECAEKAPKTPVFLMNATKDSIVPFYGGYTQWDSVRVKSSQRTIDYWFLQNGYFGHNPNKMRANNNVKRDSCHVLKKRFGVPRSRGHIDYHTIVKGKHHLPLKRENWFFGLLRRRVRVGECADIDGHYEAWQFLKQFKKRR